MLRTSTIRRFSFINSRAHEGRDTPPGNGRRTATQFQLTRPKEQARALAGFNSRAREGRDRGILQALSANVKSLVFRERQPERGRYAEHLTQELSKRRCHGRRRPRESPCVRCVGRGSREATAARSGLCSGLRG